MKRFTPKYQGIYEKAMAGRSPKAAIHAFCLMCTGCKHKAVKNCTDSTCPLFPYRPYQDNPWKARKRTKALISTHYQRDVNSDKSPKQGRLVQKDIIIENPAKRLKLRVSIEGADK